MSDKVFTLSELEELVGKEQLEKLFVQYYQKLLKENKIDAEVDLDKIME